MTIMSNQTIAPALRPTCECESADQGRTRLRRRLSFIHAVAAKGVCILPIAVILLLSCYASAGLSRISGLLAVEDVAVSVNCCGCPSSKSPAGPHSGPLGFAMCLAAAEGDA